MRLNESILLLLGIISEITQILSYTHNTGSCALSTVNQSPVNIQSDVTSFYDEKFFRILTNNYGSIPQNTTWKQYPNERSAGFEIPTTATLRIVKDWSIYQFNLKRILFRSRSEHKIDGKDFDVEMQLFHELDPNYSSPGRKQSISVKNLVISIFFQKQTNSTDEVDKLFQWTNLQGFANGDTSASFSRRILLGKVIQHVPSYLYQGTYTFPTCEETFWIIMTKYATISDLDLSNLNKVLAPMKDSTTNSNARDINVFFNSKNVYRNFKNQERMLIEKSYFRYVNSGYLKLTMLMFVIIAIFYN